MARTLAMLALMALLSATEGCNNVAPWDSAPFCHVVLFKFKGTVTEVQKAEMLRDVRDLLAPIPSAKALWAGQPAPTGNFPYVDTNYDIGLLITFGDQRGYLAYNEHPRHQDFKKKYENMVDVRVFDFSPRGEMKP